MNNQLSKLFIYIASLFMVLAITGCESTPKEQVDYGNMFEEKELALPADFQYLSITQISEDKFICSYIDPQDHSYHLAYTDALFSTVSPIQNDAGHLIHPSELINLDHPEGTYNIGGSPIYDVDPDLNLYILQYETIIKNNLPYPSGKRMVFVYHPDGTLKAQIPLEDSSQTPVAPAFKLIVHDHRIILVSSDSIQIVDNAGNTIDKLAIPFEKAVDPVNRKETVFPTGRIVDAEPMNEGEMVYIEEKPDHIYITAYDLSNHKALWSHPVSDNFLPVKLQYDREQDRIFAASNQKLNYYSRDGTEAGEILDLNQYRVGQYTAQQFNGDQTLTPAYLLFQSSHSMLVYLTGTPAMPQIKKIYAYRLLNGDEKRERIAAIEKENAAKTNITLFVPYVESRIEQIAAQYEKTHPQVHIQFAYYRENIEEFNFEDYLQYVNLQLFTNKNQWDVMAVQFIPVKNYSEKAYFADLGKIHTEQWVQAQERIFPNLIDALKINGQLMFFPSRILMNVNLAETEAAASLMPLQYTWKDLVQLSAAARAKDSAIKPWSFLGNQFPYMYEEVIHSFQVDLLDGHSSEEERQQLIRDFLEIMKTISTPESLSQNIETNPLFQLMPFMASHFPNYMDLIGKSKELLPSPASPRSGKHAFTLQEGYAVNRTSKAKEESLSFILYLAEYTDPNNIMFKDYFDRLNEQFGTSDAHKEAIRQLQTVVENLNVLRDLDHRIADAISSTTEQYINGVIDEEAAIRTIQDKLWLYENE